MFVTVTVVYDFAVAVALALLHLVSLYGNVAVVVPRSPSFCALQIFVVWICGIAVCAMRVHSSVLLVCLSLAGEVACMHPLAALSNQVVWQVCLCEVPNATVMSFSNLLDPEAGVPVHVNVDYDGLYRFRRCACVCCVCCVCACLYWLSSCLI